MNSSAAKKFLPLLSVCLLTVATQLAAANQSADDAIATATGYWQTNDDETHQPRSIVKICQLKNHLLFGRVIQVNYSTNEAPSDVCNLCAKTDPRYNQPNLGIIFLTDMQQTASNVWDNGKVLDPHNGKVYDAKITLAPDGNTLVVRGYLGISLLGRSQTWNRLTEPQLEQNIGKILPNHHGEPYLTTSTGKFLAIHYDSCEAMQAQLNSMTN